MNANNQIALFNAEIGYLLWIGEAESHHSAIRALIAEVRFDKAFAIRVADVTKEHAEALAIWWEESAHADAYLTYVDTGVIYDAEAMAAITGLPVEDASDDDWSY